MSGAQQLIVISGPPGSGKTRLASLLRERHGWPLLAKDAIKESLFDTLGAGDPAWSRRLSDASFELLFTLAAHAAGAAPVLVIEGNFRVEHASRIERLAADLGATLLHVVLDASPQVLEQRLRRRAASEARHPGHRDTELAEGVAHGAATPKLELDAQRLEFDTSLADGATSDAIAAHVARHIERRAMC